MSDCERLSDRMPEVARGGSAWSAAEASHLAGCVECRNGLALVRAAAGFGDRVGRQVDGARIARQVTDRLRVAATAAPGRMAWAPRRLILPVAVAAALVLAVWTAGPGGVPSVAPADTLVAMLHELDDLDADELEVVLQAVGVPVEETYRPIEAPDSFGDLTDAELEVVLSTLEG